MPKKRYTQQDLLAATNAVRQGVLSLRKASARYGVPVMTIQDRVKGVVDDCAKAGRPTVIPDEIEQQLVMKIKQASAQGFGITPQTVRVRVGRIVRRLRLKTPFKAGIPGKDWMTGFIKRHPDISLRTPAALSTIRAKMLNDTVVSNYYDGLRDILNSLDIVDKPKRIWNIDETSVPLTHKPSKVLGATGAKNIPGRVGNCRDNVSVLACVNADGGEVPPMVIVKGKTYKSLFAYNTKEGVPDSTYTWQEKAWMEDVLGEHWFQKHFLKFCGEERPQLILLDSHTSHETFGLIDLCMKNDIALLAFPPHTTQWLCPLDKTIFGPLSREYSSVCTEFMASSPNNLVTKWEWPKLFREAHEKAFTPSNIKSGFKKCGIYPLDRGALPATSPSDPFHRNLMPPSATGQSLQGPMLPNATATVPTEQEPMLPNATTTVPTEQEPMPMNATATVPAEQEPMPMNATATVPTEQEQMPMNATATVRTEQEPMPMNATATVPTEQEPMPMNATATVPTEQEPMPMNATATVPTEQALMPMNAIATVPMDQEPMLPTAAAIIQSEQGLVLPTGAEATVLTEQELLQSVLNGSVPFSFDSEGVINVELPVVDYEEYICTPEVISKREFMYTPSTTEWELQVDDAFQLPVADRHPKTSSKKITSHRLLTSQEIYEKKLDMKIKKENETLLKEKRKIDRQKKKEMKKEVKKRPKKVTKNETKTEICKL